MIAISTLTRRIERLEPVPDPQPDIVGAVLSSLSDAQIDLLHEMAVLRESGFDEEQTALMMGSRYRKSQKALGHFQKAYQEVVSASRKERGVHGI